MQDIDEEIREIKKEIIEGRNLTIKTNNQVSALGSDIKAIAKKTSELREGGLRGIAEWPTRRLAF